MEIIEVLKLFNDLIKPSKSENVPDFPSHNLIFRGQSNEAWGLLPKIFRTEYQQEEKPLIDNYRRRYNISGDNYLESIIDMQHYGMPTKLLDWTENILIAIYFAVGDPFNDNENAKIFIMDSKELNYFDEEIIDKYKKLSNLLLPSFQTDLDYSHEIKQILNEIENTNSSENLALEDIEGVLTRNLVQTYKLDSEHQMVLYNIITKPLLVRPFNLNSRIISQSSLFTYHFGSEIAWLNSVNVFDLCTRFTEKSDQEILHSNKPTNLNLAYITIPSLLKKQLRYELNKYFNINAATIFPDDKEKVLSQYVTYNDNRANNFEQNNSYQLQISSIY